MEINKVKGSIITEHGDINNPTINNNRNKAYQEPSFWKGFFVGFLSSLLASIVFYFITN